MSHWSLAGPLVFKRLRYKCSNAPGLLARRSQSCSRPQYLYQASLIYSAVKLYDEGNVFLGVQELLVPH
jgi:hypothetical protein